MTTDRKRNALAACQIRQYIDPLSGEIVTGYTIGRASLGALPSGTGLAGLAPVGKPWGAVIRARSVRPEGKLPACEFAPIWAFVKVGQTKVKVYVLD